jgi:Zn-dependent membrane protease YugP
MYYGYGFDPLYLLLVLPPLLLGFWAQSKVRGAYAKYTNVKNYRGLTGEDAAKIILGPEGLYEVSIDGVPGTLTDRYDPRSKKLGLSAGVAKYPTVAALAIVAHEIGHALQDHENYGPLKLRAAIVPAVQLSAWVGPILFLAGLFLRFTGLAWLGVFAFGLTAVFAIMTLPVEFDASKRGLRLLQTYNLVDSRELQGAKSVLDAAALTYVAAAVQAVATMLYYVTLLSGRRR